MRKLSCVAAVAVACVFAFSSCAPEDPAQAINVDEVFSSKATIEGYAYMNVNTSSSEATQFVPKGTKLTFSIKNSDLMDNASMKGSYVVMAEVDSVGYYKAVLPAKEDGTSVDVAIQGQSVFFKVKMNDGSEKQLLYKADDNAGAGITQAIVKDLTYQKKITYILDDTFTESEVWEEGVFKAELTYYNGKQSVAVPEGTEVKIIIKGDKFVPERDNDLILVEKVGANGMLEVKMAAPSLLANSAGLSFELSSAFIADYINVESGNEVKSSYLYKLVDNLGANQTGTVYGGQTNNVELTYEKDAEPLEAGQTAWKPATYTVKLRYKRDLTSADLSALPDDAKITVTAKRSAVPGLNLEDIVIIKSESNPLEFTFEAPDPAVSDSPLTFSVKVDFLADVDQIGDGSKTKYKFSSEIIPNGSLWGGIDKKYDDGDNTIVVTGNPL